jgi:putative transposase
MVDEVRAVWQVSIRRACQALPVDRSTYHYRSKRTGQAIVMKRVKAIAETRVRYGYRRIHVLLRREGWQVNAKRVCRLYREMGLQLRSKSPKRRVKAQLREDRSPATEANQVWAMDFVHDQMFDGRKIRILTIIDTFTRLSPAIGGPLPKLRARKNGPRKWRPSAAALRGFLPRISGVRPA